jgi:hypothetical protein
LSRHFEGIQIGVQRDREQLSCSRAGRARFITFACLKNVAKGVGVDLLFINAVCYIVVLHCRMVVLKYRYNSICYVGFFEIPPSPPAHRAESDRSQPTYFNPLQAIAAAPRFFRKRLNGSNI